MQKIFMGNTVCVAIVKCVYICKRSKVLMSIFQAKSYTGKKCVSHNYDAMTINRFTGNTVTI